MKTYEERVAEMLGNLTYDERADQAMASFPHSEVVREYDMGDLVTRVDTEYRQDRLRRQLENDEPKCANCRCWARYVDPDPQSFGVCALSQQRTTDLTVCASWSPKG